MRIARISAEDELTLLPGNSGNGLARSLAHENGVKYSPGNGVIPSALALVRKRSKPMDLVVINTASGRDMYSFLSVGWGLLSDIDIESERLRFLGEPRFTVWSLLRTMNLRSYKGRLSFKLAQQPAPSTEATVRRPGVSREVDGDRFNGGDAWKQREAYATAEALPCHTPPATHLRPLGEPVPEDWQVVVDDFLFMYAVNCAYIGTDARFAPDSSCDDGKMALVFVRKGMSRVDIVRTLYAAVVYNLR